jgi:hypothetical protein
MTVLDPKTEQDARSSLTVLWFGMLAVNILVALISYLLGTFGGQRDLATQQALLKAFDGVFFVFAPNLTAISTYWFALKGRRTGPLLNSVPYYISLGCSVLWGLMITVVHLFGGPNTYEDVLPPLSMHSNWLVSGALAYYFASGKPTASGEGAKKAPLPSASGRVKHLPGGQA